MNEKDIFKKVERAETNSIVDWFSTLEEVKIVKKRLYNERHRTDFAKRIWNKLPEFLEENRDLLALRMGKNVTVHLFGSALLGMATEGKMSNNREKWEIWPSDIDLLIFAEEDVMKAQNTQGRQSEKDEYRGAARFYRFLEESEFNRKFDGCGEGVFVNVPELAAGIKKICSKFFNNQEITLEDRDDIFYAAMLFGSDALFQNTKNIEAKWRNEILKIILENQGGEKLWNEGIREYFNKYIAGYEHNAFSSQTQERHKSRVDFAFDKILSEKNVSPDSIGRAKKSISQMRSKINLPEFKIIKKRLEEKLRYV